MANRIIYNLSPNSLQGLLRRSDKRSGDEYSGVLRQVVGAVCHDTFPSRHDTQDTRTLERRQFEVHSLDALSGANRTAPSLSREY